MMAVFLTYKPLEIAVLQLFEQVCSDFHVTERLDKLGQVVGLQPLPDLKKQQPLIRRGVQSYQAWLTCCTSRSFTLAGSADVGLTVGPAISSYHTAP